MSGKEDAIAIERAAHGSRMLWLVLMACQFVFLFYAVAFIYRTPIIPPEPKSANSINSEIDQANIAAMEAQSPHRILFYVALITSCISIPVALTARQQFFKRNWESNSVSPRGYLEGQLCAWCVCLLAALFGIVVCILYQKLFPYIIAAVIPMILLALLYPNGQAMQDTPTEIASNE